MLRGDDRIIAWHAAEPTPYRGTYRLFHSSSQVLATVPAASHIQSALAAGRESIRPPRGCGRTAGRALAVNRAVEIHPVEERQTPVKPVARRIDAGEATH